MQNACKYCQISLACHYHFAKHTCHQASALDGLPTMHLSSSSNPCFLSSPQYWRVLSLQYIHWYCLSCRYELILKTLTDWLCNLIYVTCHLTWKLAVSRLMWSPCFTSCHNMDHSTTSGKLTSFYCSLIILYVFNYQHCGEVMVFSDIFVLAEFIWACYAVQI